MDFASLMSAELSKKKDPPVQSESAKKYLKKAELETQRQEAYLKEQAALQRERESKLQQKRKRDEEEADKARERDEKRRRLAEESKSRREEQEAREERARRKRIGLPELPANNQNSSEETPRPDNEEDIPEPELHLKLRTLNEPVILFGESHSARLKRYKILTAATKSLTPTSTGPIPTTLPPLPESDLKIPTTIPKTPEARTYLYRQLSTYFNLLFTEWAHTLAARPLAVKTTSQGIQAASTMQSSLTSLHPLVQKLESNTLSDSILAPLLEIVCAVQERRYVDANDGYLRLSIGKAAWPIGVTMVGIHERSAREKLHESDVQGHIMSDEVTRKFLQGIKRCLSFAQTRWPPEDFGQLMG